MNTIRKIAQWIWLNKERMVLAVMVVFLIYRVYEVVNPEVEVTQENYRPPEPRGNVGVITVPPPPPTPQGAPDMTRRHPFVWVGKNTAGAGTDGGPQVDLRLIRILETGGSVKANIRSPGRTYWLEEGDDFETYELVEINQERGEVLIYAHNIDDEVILTIE